MHYFVRRVLFRLLVLIFLVASLGCQRKFVAKTPLQLQRNEDKIALAAVDSCIKVKQSIANRGLTESMIHSLCAAYVAHVEENLDKVQDEKLKKLVLGFASSKGK